MARTEPRRTAAATRGPAAAAALRQARPAALHQPPRLPARLRAGAAPGRRADGLLGRLHPAPQDLLRRRRADRRGQRGRVPRDRSRTALRPGGGTRWTRALPPGLDVLEVVEARAGSASPTGSTPRTWRIELPTVSPADASGRRRPFLAADARCPCERLMKDGRRQLDARVGVSRDRVGLEPGGGDAPAGVGDRPCAILDLVVRQVTPAVRPDDVLSAPARGGRPGAAGIRSSGDPAGAGVARRRRTGRRPARARP